MRILVTGAAGMIGSHLCDHLVGAGYRVLGIDDLSFGSLENLKQLRKCSNFTLSISDLSKTTIKEDCDFIFHLASLKKAPNNTIKSSDILNTNAAMTSNVASYAAANEVPIVFSSTSDIYGNSKQFAESEQIVIGPPTIGRYTYAVSKLFSEQYLLNLSNDQEIQSCIIRVFGCFSERSNRSWSGGHVPLFIDKALSNQDIVIHGDGLQTRSMCYVSDIIDGMVLCLDNFQKCNGEIINIGTSEEFSVLECAKEILRITKSSSGIKFVQNAHGQYPEIIRRFANTEKAKKLLGYSPKTKFLESLERVVNLWKN